MSLFSRLFWHKNSNFLYGKRPKRGLISPLIHATARIEPMLNCIEILIISALPFYLYLLLTLNEENFMHDHVTPTYHPRPRKGGLDEYIIDILRMRDKGYSLEQVAIVFRTKLNWQILNKSTVKRAIDKFMSGG